MQNSVCMCIFLFLRIGSNVFNRFLKGIVYDLPTVIKPPTTALGKLEPVQIKTYHQELFHLQVFLHVLNKYLSICSGHFFKCQGYGDEQDRKIPALIILFCWREIHRKTVIISKNFR